MRSATRRLHQRSRAGKLEHRQAASELLFPVCPVSLTLRSGKQLLLPTNIIGVAQCAVFQFGSNTCELRFVDD